MKLIKYLIIISILFFLVSFHFFRELTVRPNALTDAVIVYFPKGSSSQSMIAQLNKAGVVEAPIVFRILGRIKGLDTKLKAGEYEFLPHASIVDVLDKLAKGDVYYRKLTLPEGLTIKQFVDIINEEEFLEGEISTEFREGELLPETYSFERGMSRDTFALRAREAMKNTLNQYWEAKDEGVPLKNKQELLILASIVEKETGVPEERGLVASVFVNRLKKGMMLQTDPTVIYALTKGKFELDRSLKRADLQVDDKYNTYKYYGLPPTPICNPGKEAIKAAAQPDVSQFLYFVASGTGGHNFSTTLEGHNKNVRSWVNKIRNK